MDESFFTLDNFPNAYLLSTSIQMFYHMKNIIGNGVQQNFDIASIGKVMQLQYIVLEVVYSCIGTI